ncbi:MAG: hypothetical protein NWE83_12865, partial [Candidatus Bathyarchaeota archaeon]|nr:hypothetical protein [Candidatus Bathyarchaeota archaeon]
HSFSLVDMNLAPSPIPPIRATSTTPMVKLLCSIENNAKTPGIQSVIVMTFRSTFNIMRNSVPSADPAGRLSRSPNLNGS